MSTLLYYLLGKKLKFPMDFQYYRVGKSKGFLEEANKLLEEESVQWHLTEVEALGDIHIPRVRSLLLDAYLINLDVNEYNLEDMRREFWELIWREFPPLPLALIIPDTLKGGALSIQDVLEGLSLIRLTDRPWRVFVNKAGFEQELLEWLFTVSSTPRRRSEKLKHLKELEKQSKAEANNKS